MIVEPKVKGFICTTALSCRLQRECKKTDCFIVKKKGMVEGPKKVLVIGSFDRLWFGKPYCSNIWLRADTIGGI